MYLRLRIFIITLTFTFELCDQFQTYFLCNSNDVGLNLHHYESWDLCRASHYIQNAEHLFVLTRARDFCISISNHSLLSKARFAGVFSDWLLDVYFRLISLVLIQYINSLPVGVTLDLYLCLFFRYHVAMMTLKYFYDFRYVRYSTIDSFDGDFI